MVTMKAMTVVDLIVAMAATATKETIEPSKAMKVMTANAEDTRYACPFHKRNPLKYGQPQWKRCAHPGWDSVHRVNLLLSRKEIGNKKEEEKWAYMYQIVFPEDGVTPNPYQYSLDKARKVNEFDRVDEYRRHLVRELPSFIK
ncbi:hypothetical protein BKA56DRAFT_668630 [Ilyonectria sp. MPI-CAGE-AT-0026]|nr:hypothetical protein BKA56DRAFT_668630 [Ilyonectria sp. MPI-CAGE-AT-0026]